MSSPQRHKGHTKKGTMNEERESKTARKMERVKERGGAGQQKSGPLGSGGGASASLAPAPPYGPVIDGKDENVRWLLNFRLSNE